MSPTGPHLSPCFEGGRWHDIAVLGTGSSTRLGDTTMNYVLITITTSKCSDHFYEFHICLWLSHTRGALIPAVTYSTSSNLLHRKIPLGRAFLVQPKVPKAGERPVHVLCVTVIFQLIICWISVHILRSNGVSKDRMSWIGLAGA